MFASFKTKFSVLSAFLLIIAAALSACDDGGVTSSGDTANIDIGEGRTLGDPNAFSFM